MKAQQLKNAILQLAIQGKLVPQDPNDEPASVLLEKIKQEKEKLIAEGKIKKSKKSAYTPPYLNESEFPFEIPESWVWVRLEDICETISDIDHKMPREYKGSDGIPYISPRDFYGSNHINYDNAKKISEDDYLLLSKKFSPKLNDIIFPRYGTIGIIRVINYTKPLLVSYSCACIRILNRFINLNYIICYLQSELAQQEIRKYTNKTTQPNVGLQSIKNFLVPLPPINEQNKISEKLEVLLPFIEQYAKKEQELTSLHQAFPEQLKKSILQAAIQGKLTEQNPNDEPAVELVKRIQAEKERLILEKKIKKPKQHSEIIVRDNSHYEIIGGAERCIDDEIPFEIPESWCWIRLGNITDIARGASPRPINEYLTNDETGIPWIKIGDTELGGKYIYSTKERIISSAENLSRRIDVNDFLLTNSMSFGRPYISKISGCIHDGWLVIKFNNDIFNIDFLYYLLSSPFMFSQFSNNAAGSAFKNLKSDTVRNSLVALPPLDEQKRIVAKIEQLFLSLENLG